MSIWNTLAAIDCNEHVKSKGGYSYLSWTWAWAMVKENYPKSYYELKEDITYPDGTMEVRIEVTIIESGDKGSFLSHTMWLPVLDNRNNAIQNPNAFDINSSRMRCLVKCLAMFGLGHYIYAGESLPQERGATEDDWEEFLQLIATKDATAVSKYMSSLDDKKAEDLFNMAPKGHKTKFKDAVRELQGQHMAMVGSYVTGLTDGINDHSAVLELVAELDDPFVKKQVWAQLDPVIQQQIKDILKEAA